jgi:osmotically-inducible protein OsmY/uncharacterized protein YrrD
MPEPRLELKIGAPVDAADGPFGRLHQVILSPVESRVVALIVRRTPWPPREVVVPATEIAEATEQRVRLRVPRAELEGRAEVDRAEYVELARDSQGYGPHEALVAIHGGLGDASARALVAAHLGAEARIAHQGRLAGQVVALRRGQPVWAADGRAGRVDLLLLDAAGQVRHFVIRKGFVLGRDVIVPVDWVSRIDERGVWLAVEHRALDRLPPYRPDSEIAADVDRALERDPVISVLDYDLIEVQVQDGVVSLRGHAASPISKARAESAARAVPGVQQVENGIVTDGELVAAIEQALAGEPALRAQPITVQAEHGVVYLCGYAMRPELRAAAEAIAAGVPQVRAVVNELLAPGVAGVQVLRTLELAIGQAVEASDMPLGLLERVVVSPQRRRVMALVVSGALPDLARATPQMLPAEMPKQPRRVVITADAVRCATPQVVHLRISGLDAARCPDFDPACFVGPDATWPAIGPFQPADMLLDMGCAEAVRLDLHPADGGPAALLRDSPGTVTWARIEHGMPVHCRAGLAGAVDHVAVDRDVGIVRRVIVGAGALLSRDASVPIDWVRSVDDQGVFVDAGAAQLEALLSAGARLGDVRAGSNR